MRIVVVGGGIGGLTTALAAARVGHEVVVLEQASAFTEVGAGIQISPNGGRVLHALGLGAELDRIGIRPERAVMRRWADDRLLLARPLGRAVRDRYGHGYHNVFRPDLIDLLAGAVARAGVEVSLGTTVTGVDAVGDGRSPAAVTVAGGTSIEADVVVGADGIRSAVRASLFGPAAGRFARLAAYRALIPADATDLPIEVTNRMGPDRHLVSYYVGARTDRPGPRFLNLVGVVPEPTWEIEGWTEPGSLDDLRAHFDGWAPAVGRLLDLVIEPVHRWALHDRPPLERWGRGRVTLLGDACHPMLPFMAQGACQAIEDAAVLVDCLSRHPEVPTSVRRYEDLRRSRTADVQRRSWRNATTFHLPDGEAQEARDARLAEVDVEVYGGGDAGAFDWLYGYDATTVVESTAR